MKAIGPILLDSAIYLISGGDGFAKTITIAADGSGDFKTLQQAIAAAPEVPTDRTIIHLKAGSYEGQTVIPKNKSKITLEGDGIDSSHRLSDDEAAKMTIPNILGGTDRWNPIPKPAAAAPQ